MNKSDWLECLYFPSKHVQFHIVPANPSLSNHTSSCETCSQGLAIRCLCQHINKKTFCRVMHRYL